MQKSPQFFNQLEQALRHHFNKYKKMIWLSPQSVLCDFLIFEFLIFWFFDLFRCVKLLVQHHARIDALNDEMATPLHIAAAFNHKDVVEFLIER